MARPAAGTCEVCGDELHSVDGLASHLIDRAADSDAAHVMWLNRNVTKHRVDAPELAALLRARADGGHTDTQRVAR